MFDKLETNLSMQPSKSKNRHSRLYPRINHNQKENKNINNITRNLGTLFSRDGKHEDDIERRVNLGNHENGALHSFLSSQNVSKSKVGRLRGRVSADAYVW